MSSDVQLLLAREQALVLFDFLSRYSDSDELSIQDQSEQRVLWDIQARLESVLTEHLDPQYTTILRRARETVRDQLA